MAELFKIVQCLDEYLSRNNLESIGPVEGGQILERAGLLTDSKIRPGLPLRTLLREGKLPHARQPGGKGSSWFIYHSGGRPYQIEADITTKMLSPKLSQSRKTFESPRTSNSTKVVAKGDHSQYETTLMLETSFKSAGTIDEIVSDEPGVYCIRILDLQPLPEAFRIVLEERGHNIIYIGLASGSLKKRFLGQELRARGHGTFFRSVGAMLGYLPPAGSLASKKNKKNYVFSAQDEQAIIRWMNTHLVVNWLEMTGDIDALESYLIPQYKPLLNLAKNPSRLAILSEARKKCCEVAGGSSDCTDI